MSIQRWQAAILAPGIAGMKTYEYGGWVDYADHLAAYEDVKKRAYLHGLNAARDAVRALPDWKFCDAVCGTERSALAAIDALRGDA